MRISIDGRALLTLSDHQKNVIKHDIPSSIFDADMIRRMKYVVEHPVLRYIASKKEEWIKQLELGGAQSYPSDPLDLASLVVDSSSEAPISVEVEGVQSFVLSPIQVAIFKLASKESLESVVSRALLDKYERCLERFQRRWEPEFVKESRPIPISKEAFATAVFSRNDYKDRMARDLEAPVPTGVLGVETP